jgi:energy-coupling factor transporter transmembrane protein EcfT
MSQADNGLVKLIGMIGVGARISVKPLLILIFGSAVTTIMAVIYLHWAMFLGWSWSLVPLWLMVLPMTGLVFYWFTLDGLSRLPQTLLESKETFSILKQRYAERKNGKEIKGIGPVATTRRMLLLGGLLWDSRDVIDAASNLYGLLDLFNPFFWLMMLISFVSTVVLCGLYVISCGGHYLFS